MYKVRNNAPVPVEVFVLGKTEAFVTLLPEEETALPADRALRGFAMEGVTYTCSPLYAEGDPLDRVFLIPAEVEGKYMLIREQGTDITVLFKRL